VVVIAASASVPLLAVQPVLVLVLPAPSKATIAPARVITVAPVAAAVGAVVRYEVHTHKLAGSSMLGDAVAAFAAEQLLAAVVMVMVMVVVMVIGVLAGLLSAVTARPLSSLRFLMLLLLLLPPIVAVLRTTMSR
jgi:hypothetical protein